DLLERSDNSLGRWTTFRKVFKQGALDQVLGLRIGLRNLKQNIRDLPDKLSNALSKLGGSLRSLLKSARKGASELVDKLRIVAKNGLSDLGDNLSLARRSASEWLAEGTVQKFQNTKVVRTGFVDQIDPATPETIRVAQYKTVLRQDFAGTSYTARLRQFRETWSSVKVDARTKIVKTVEQTTDATGQVRRAIKETTVLRESWLKKLNSVDETLIKYDNTK